MRALRSGRVISVAGLAELSGVSPITIRRDLAELEAAGLLRRTHGGAVRTMQRGNPLPFEVRHREGLDEKTRLAAGVSALVADYESVIVDNGTTCYAVALQLAGRPITALALSLHAATALAAVPGCEVIIPGGTVETDSLACTGTQVLEAIRAMRVDTTILGACSASPLAGLTSTSLEDARIKRAAIDSATRRILAVSADKLTRSSSFKFGDPAELSHLVTTTEAPEDVLSLYRDEAVEVITV
jgi:DeoR/GlpR family transcriptional regulator of sugar metabolism